MSLKKKAGSHSMDNALDSVGSLKAAKYFPLGCFSSRMSCDKYCGNVSFYKFQVLKLHSDINWNIEL